MTHVLLAPRTTRLLLATAAIFAACTAQAAPGDLDPAFGIGGKVTGSFNTMGSDDAKAIARDSSGNIYVAGNGYSSLGGGSTDYSVAKFDQSGNRITTFGTGGTLRINVSTYYDIATSLVIVGGYGYIAGSSDIGTSQVLVVSKFDLNGQLVPSFGSGGIATVNFGANTRSFAEAVGVDGAGNIFLAGATRTSPATSYSLAAAKLDATGALVPSFGTGGLVTIALSGYSASFFALAPDSAGGIYVGATRYASSASSIVVYQLGASGLPVNGFGVAGSTVISFTGNYDELHALVRAGNGDIYLSGTAQNFSNVHSICVAKMDANGVLASDFGTGGKALLGRSGHILEGMAMALDPDGNVYVAGVDEGSSSNFLAGQFDRNGNVSSTFGSGGLVDISFSSGYDFGRATMLDGNGHLYVTGIIDAIDIPDFGIARLMATPVDMIFKNGFDQ